jgi:hypothetical protein
VLSTSTNVQRVFGVTATTWTTTRRIGAVRAQAREDEAIMRIISGVRAYETDWGD